MFAFYYFLLIGGCFSAAAALCHFFECSSAEVVAYETATNRIKREWCGDGSMFGNGRYSKAKPVLGVGCAFFVSACK